MFDILQKAGRGVKKFMSEKINTCKEILSSAQNRLIIGLVMIFLTIVAVFAADRVVRPLHQIAATIENVSAGYSDDVLHVDTFTETKSISEAINKMMGRLKLLDDSREEFVIQCISRN